VAAGDEREHEVGRGGVEGDVADLVDDHERDPEQLAQLFVEAALPLGVAEAGDPLGRGREGDALAGEAGADAERDRQDASMAVKSCCLRGSASFRGWMVGVEGVGGDLRACERRPRVIAGVKCALLEGELDQA
jgi:hypothetical protein